MAKKKFKVQAEVVTYCYVIIEANSKEEAHKIAEEMDGGDFITDTTDNGEFNVLESLTEEVKKGKKKK